MKIYSIGKRAVALLLSIVMIIGTFPTAVIAAGRYGSITMLGEGSVVNDATENVTAVVSNVNLDHAQADPVTGHPGGWAVGVKVTAPAALSPEQLHAVTYQEQNAGTWSEAMPFEEPAQTADSRNFWTSVTEQELRSANIAQKPVERVWRFDWNGDGQYEQTATVRVQPEAVRLMQENKQVYPAENIGYGSLEPVKTATIAGNGTNGISVLYTEKMDVEWTAAEAGKGQPKDGWWLQLRMLAPEGLSEEQLKNARYTVDKENKSFWSDKTVSGNGTSYVALWICLDKLVTGDFKAPVFRFDWNNDGIAEQAVTVEVMPDNVRLMKAGEQIYPVPEKSSFGKVTADQGTVVGNDTENTEVTVENATLEWTLDNGKKVWNVIVRITAPESIDRENWNKIKYQEKNGRRWTDKNFNHENGTLTIAVPLTPEQLKNLIAAQKDLVKEYRFDWNADQTYEQKLKITVAASDQIVLARKNQTGFQFEIEKPGTFIYYSMKENTYQNTARGGESAGNVTYEIISGQKFATIDRNGVLKAQGEGMVTVRATKAGDDYYNPITAQYTIELRKGDNVGQFQYGNTVETTYKSGLTYTNPIIFSVQGSSRVVYQIMASASDRNVATIDSQTGKLTILKAGTVKVKASWRNDWGINKVDEYTLTVHKANMDGFGFGAEAVSITWQPGTVNALPLQNSYGKGQVTWSILPDPAVPAGSEVASVDRDGRLTLNRPGTFTLQAQKKGDDCYNDSALATTVVTVTAASQDFTFSETEVKKNYGIKEYTNTVKDTAGKFASPITYTISENNIGAVIDAETGKISFTDSVGKVGTVTVTAARKANDFYEAFSTSYTLEVSYLTGIAPVIVGDKLNDSGWYTSEQVALKAPRGYTIGTSNALSAAEWTDSINYPADTEVTVYLKRADGVMTDGYRMKPIHIDTKDPTDLKVNFDKKLADKILEGITFGIYEAPLTVTVEASDAESGIAALSYSTGELHDTISFAGVPKATHSFVIDADHRDSITISAVDVAGHTVELKNGNVIVVDKTNPKLTVDYTFDEDGYTEENGVFYTDGDVTVRFTIDEANFDLSELPVVTVNNQKKTLDWVKTSSGTAYTAELNLPDENKYTLRLRYQDVSGHNLQENNEQLADGYIKHIVTDCDVPEVTVDEAVILQNRYIVLTVLDRYFRKDGLNFQFKARNILGDEESIIDKQIIDALLQNDAKPDTEEGGWFINADGNYCIKLPITMDGNYEVETSYTSLSNKDTGTRKFNFSVDTTAANNVTIKRSKAVAEQILETLSLGFYKAPVHVAVSAEDMTTGVKEFVLTYTKSAASGIGNQETFTRTLPAEQNKKNKNIFTAEYDLEAPVDGFISVVAVDNAGNRSIVCEDGTRIVVDSTNPTILAEYQYANGSMDRNGISYTQGAVSAVFTVTETNFALAERPVVTVNDAVQTVEWTQTPGTDTWTCGLNLSGQGDYHVTITFKDGSTNAMQTYEKQINIDSTSPVIEVVYDNQNAFNGNCYQGQRVAAVTVTEHNFNAASMDVQVTAQNIYGEAIDVADYAAFAHDSANWNHQGDVHTLELPAFERDAVYHVAMNCTDESGNAAAENLSDFIVDNTGPREVKIQYSSPLIEKIFEQITFGYYKASVIVTVSAEDKTSGIDYFNLTYSKAEDAGSNNKETFTEKLLPAESASAGVCSASFVLNEQIRGSFHVEIFDKAANTSAFNDDEHTIVLDQINPNISTIFTALQPESRMFYRNADGVLTEDFATAHSAYCDGSMVSTITVNEENFFEGELARDGVIHEIILKVTRIDENNQSTVTEYLPKGAKKLVEDADQVKYITWKAADGVCTTSVEFEEEGDYILEISYADYSNNGADISGNDGHSASRNYASKVMTVDKTAQNIEISYDNNDARNDNCYQDNRNATVTIAEHNFRAEDVELTVSAKNILDQDVPVMDYKAYAKDPANWVTSDNLHTLVLPFTADAAYTVDMSYTDLSGNQAAMEQQSFTVDHEVAKNIQISYETPVLSKTLEGLTFGFYKADTRVTVTAEDITAGVESFKLTYTRDKNATDAHKVSFTEMIKAEQNGAADQFKAVMRLPVESRGSFSVAVIDRAGNEDSLRDETNMIVTDTVSPEIDVTYKAEKEDTKIQFVDASGSTVKSFADAKTAYYNGSVVSTVTVHDSNFFEGMTSENNEIVNRLLIKLTRTDDDGNVTVKNYRVGADGDENIVWKTKGDTHTVQFVLAEDGDYVFDITYTDYSGNDASIESTDGQTVSRAYTSKTITVDKTAPVVTVDYKNKNVVHTIEGRDYLDQIQNGVVTVYEHNFRAADFATAVTAENVVGDDIGVMDYAAYLSNDANWTHNGNVHTANIVFDVDANYTFDVKMQDLAKNDSSEYKQDLFTVDTTAPTDVKISYSTSVLQQILEGISIGYYNAKVTVTISAADITSGIYHFAYSYLNNANVSGVNAELLNQAIAEADVSYDGATATATFTIPKDVLGPENQFDGTVRFTSFDRSENDTEMKDTTQIVVDNISPNGTISYNEPAQQANGISYYSGEINAAIDILEANFDSGDVSVAVTKDGASYPVSVSWTDNSVDSHIGRFTLAEDGDYIVHVSYSDKSGNHMEQYESNQLTVDTVKPTIRVSNIVANSANKDKTYGFEMTFEDINLDASLMKPVLTAVMQGADGKFNTRTIDIGKAGTIVGGQKYVYTVENLPEDALYTLSASVKDMSGNEYSRVILDNGQAYNKVQFSVNRNGSAFGFGDEATEKLVRQYYVHDVTNDVVIVEVNVDPVEKYEVTLNGATLKEGKDYTTTQTSKAGEWSKRTYSLSSKLFAEEGEYNIVIRSEDKTKTTAFSDVKNLQVGFIVDRTAPVLTITGLQNGGRYQTDAQNVTVILTDDGGRLNKLSILAMDASGNPLTDENGKNISERFLLSGQELLDYLENHEGKVTFTVPEGLENQVQIVCTDSAMDAEGLANEYNELFRKVTVSQNAFIIFYANKPLFFGSIAAVVAVAALVTILILKKKKKADEE